MYGLVNAPLLWQLISLASCAITLNDPLPAQVLSPKSLQDAGLLPANLSLLSLHRIFRLQVFTELPMTAEWKAVNERDDQRLVQGELF